MKRRNVLSSPRLSELKKRRKRAVLNKFLILVLGLIAVFGLLAYISRLNNLNISNIQILNNKVLDAEKVKTTIQTELAGKYLWLFPKTNILYYPKSAIENTLQKTYSRIKNIDLSIKNNEILEVSLVEREAKYTWCGNVIPTLNSGAGQKCYFMDSGGYIFDEAPYFSGNVYFKFYGDNFDTKNIYGSYFLKDKFSKVIAFKEEIKGMGLAPTSFWVDHDGNAHFSLSGEPMTGPEIIFKIDADLEKIAENLQAALNTEPLKSKMKNNFSTLLYIDLRFGNKVYDKFK